MLEARPVFIRWDESFSVKNPTIDAQHQKIIHILNQLFEFRKKTPTQAILMRIAEDLLAYTLNHFKDEEEFMKTIQYPELESHQHYHQWMSHKTKDFNQQIRAGFLEVTDELMQILKKWWVEHILQEDRKYSAYIQGET